MTVNATPATPDPITKSMTHKARAIWSKMDWRGHFICRVTALLAFLTVAVYLLASEVVPLPGISAFFGNWAKPETAIGALFASWAGGLALFVIAGAFVAIVSFDRPEQGSFDARARILFRRQPGKHIDYIVLKIREALEHYAESAEALVAIEQFDPNEKKFRISRDSRLVVRSYIDDIETNYTTEFKLAEVSVPPAGKESNRLVFLRVNNVPVGKGETFESEINRHVSCKIDPGDSGEVHSLLEMWQEVSEPYRHSARRYTQRMSITFDNRLDNDIFIEFGMFDPVFKKMIDRSKFTTILLPAGNRRKVIEIDDIVPGIVAIEYYMKPA